MAGDTHPILLRPPAPLADAMTTAAAEVGLSRNEWMVRVLAAAVASRGHLPDDVPLVPA